MKSEAYRPVKEAMEAQEAAPDPAAIVQAHMATAARTAEDLDRPGKTTTCQAGRKRPRWCLVQGTKSTRGLETRKS